MLNLSTLIFPLGGSGMSNSFLLFTTFYVNIEIHKNKTRLLCVMDLYFTVKNYALNYRSYYLCIFF